MISDFSQIPFITSESPAGLNIPVTADPLGFYLYQFIPVMNTKTSIEQQFCRWKCLVDERGQTKNVKAIQT